jgi:hypothetical protein
MTYDGQGEDFAGWISGGTLLPSLCNGAAGQRTSNFRHPAPEPNQVVLKQIRELCVDGNAGSGKNTGKHHGRISADVVCGQRERSGIAGPVGT